MFKQHALLIVLILGISATGLFYGKVRADSQRMNPGDAYGYSGASPASKHDQQTATDSEMLFLPFKVQNDCYVGSNRYQVVTRDSYSGPVDITVSGIGQSLHAAWQDAFYIYTDEAEVPLNPYYNNYMTLWINGVGTDQYINPIPSYNPAHVYTFSMIAPGGHLSFAVGDPCPGDNTGSYLIIIEKGRKISLSASVTS